MANDGPKVPEGWVDQAWDGSESRWKDAESYCNSCLIDLNADGETKTKALCMLPYKEPSGKINVQGVMACAGGRGISRVQAPSGINAPTWSSAKNAAAKKLVSLYEKMNRMPPSIICKMAGIKPKA